MVTLIYRLSIRSAQPCLWCLARFKSQGSSPARRDVPGPPRTLDTLNAMLDIPPGDVIPDALHACLRTFDRLESLALVALTEFKLVSRYQARFAPYISEKDRLEVLQRIDFTKIVGSDAETLRRSYGVPFDTTLNTVWHSAGALLACYGSTNVVPIPPSLPAQFLEAFLALYSSTDLSLYLHVLACHLRDFQVAWGNPGALATRQLERKNGMAHAIARRAVSFASSNSTLAIQTFLNKAAFLGQRPRRGYRPRKPRTAPVRAVSAEHPANRVEEANEPEET
ncbi:hypothetical protein PAPYR_10002 [Paratrimastix pyriformis]|uniref:Uncharacterized protein n=1 Tax=Paratrimastix pyriformis TaxID=342808 RepID=A0ABQ8UE44_9EUKA|nr:hypothetical protein PAPYR_10002 [Paratrimastix pyriformis]